MGMYEDDWDLYKALSYLKEQGYSGSLEDLYKRLPVEAED